MPGFERFWSYLGKGAAWYKTITCQATNVYTKSICPGL